MFMWYYTVEPSATGKAFSHGDSLQPWEQPSAAAVLLVCQRPEKLIQGNIGGLFFQRSDQLVLITKADTIVEGLGK